MKSGHKRKIHMIVMESGCDDCKHCSFRNRDYPRLPMDIGARNGRVNIRDFRNMLCLNEDLIITNALRKTETTNRRVHPESFIENTAKKSLLFIDEIKFQRTLYYR